MGISPITSETAAAALDRAPRQQLGQDEFIKILVTQMTSQDPLNPQKDTEFIAQMAQMSALEHSKTMQQELTALRVKQDFVQANALLGRQVELGLTPETKLNGVVSEVRMEEGVPMLVVNGASHPLASVLKVWQAGEGPKAGEYQLSHEVPTHAE